jgi:hypothetical protein
LVIAAAGGSGAARGGFDPAGLGMPTETDRHPAAFLARLVDQLVHQVLESIAERRAPSGDDAGQLHAGSHRDADAAVGQILRLHRRRQIHRPEQLLQHRHRLRTPLVRGLHRHRHP